MDIDLATVSQPRARAAGIRTCVSIIPGEYQLSRSIDRLFLRIVFSCKLVGLSDFNDPIVFDSDSAIRENAPVGDPSSPPSQRF